VADIRISELPLATGPTAPAPTDVVAIDGLTTRKSVLSELANAIRPVASQAEAEAGVNATKVMSAVNVKQSIASEVGGTIASAAQGSLADTALQASDVGTAAFEPIASFMQSSVNNPQGLNLDAFSLPNMTGTLSFAQLGTDIKAAADVLITVGTGGNYSTLNAAISAASKLNNRQHVNNGFSVEIRLLTGFILAEQVLVRRMDLGFITITSVDAVVQINPTNVTLALSTADLTTPVFGGANNAVLPTIGCLFAYPNDASRRDGVAVHFGSKVGFLPGSGIRYSRRGIQALYDSEVYCYMPGLTQGGAGSGAGTTIGVTFDYGSARALHVAFGSRAGLARSEFSNNTGTGEVVYIIWGSYADLYQSQVHDNAGTAIYCRDGSFCNARETQVARSSRGYHALHNARINARSKEGADANPWIGDSAKNCVEYGVLASYNSQIDCAVVDVSGCLNRGVHASDGSHVNFYQGVAQNCAGEAVSAYDGSIVAAQNVSANGSQNGFVASNGSIIAAQASTANNCTQYGYNAVQASTINADSSQANQCGSGGFWSNEASTIQARNSQASGISGTLIPFGFQADRGSTINSRGSTSNFATASFKVQEGSNMNAQSTTSTSSTVGYTWLTGSTMNAGSTSASVSSTVNTVTAAGIGFK
jgi:hypothetical protein